MNTKLKLLIIADEGDKNLNYSKIAQEASCDLIITLGDLNDYEIKSLKETSIPKVGVYGNHCERGYMEKLNIENLHLKTTTIKGITISGFEGCVRYKERGEFQYAQEEATALLRDHKPAHVFISHAPPFGINDIPERESHTGFHAHLNYLETNKPQYWLHGHTYPKEPQHISKHKSTTVIYTHGYRIVEIEIDNFWDSLDRYTPEERREAYQEERDLIDDDLSEWKDLK